MRRYFVLSGLIFGAAACVVHADDCTYAEEYVCYLEYTPGYGYARVCEWSIDPVVCVDFDDDDEGRPSRYRRPASSLDGASGGSGTPEQPERGAETPEPPSGSEISCTRDGQCGTGLCIEGECFYGCAEDTDCGTGDVCEPITSVSVCRAPAEPDVECTRSVECGNAQICLNAACHDSCEATADCTNPLDHCESGVCVPDRSVVSECLLDRECGTGQVCIDATCQER